MKKIRITKPYGTMVGTTEVRFALRDYSVPDEMGEEAAALAVYFRCGHFLAEKVAPENKVARVPENKAEVEPVRSRGPRSKPDR
jgi:hypothetical protein